MKTLKLFISAVLAGMSIGIGGFVFLSLESKVLGALMFAVGLFVVCTFGFHLYTGKVCYVFDNDKEYALGLPVIWVGNIVGTGITALFVLMSRVGPALSEKAMGICRVKLDDSYTSLFFLGVLCNLLIYIAVEGYRSNPHELGKYMSIVFGVMVFILAGTEHCIADVFYFWMAKAWSGQAVLAIVVITLGNSVGGLILPLLRKITQAKNK